MEIMCISRFKAYISKNIQWKELKQHYAVSFTLNEELQELLQWLYDYFRVECWASCPQLPQVLNGIQIWRVSWPQIQM